MLESVFSQGGCCLSACLGSTGSRHPPGNRHPPGTDTPQSRHPLGADTPQEQTPPKEQPPEQTPPGEEEIRPLCKYSWCASYNAFLLLLILKNQVVGLKQNLMGEVIRLDTNEVLLSTYHWLGGEPKPIRMGGIGVDMGPRGYSCTGMGA